MAAARSVPPKSLDTPKAKKERVIALLTKVNDRDTQRKATEELHELVYDKQWMDSEALFMLIHQLCIPTPVQKGFARKECAHILGMLASSQCPAQSSAVAAPALQKIITQLRKYMQDPDSLVRDAASEAAARVARGLWERGGVGAGGEVHSGSTNPVGRMLLDCLAEGKRELQAAACGALGQAAPYLGKVDTVMVKEVVKRLNSPSFQAQPALLMAVGQIDATTGSAAGLIQAGGSVLHHHLPQLIGHPGATSGSGVNGVPGVAASTSSLLGPAGGAGTSSGLCACLGSKDWMTRKAASDCLHALFLVLGPLCEPEGVWDASDPRSLTNRCARMLDGARFDKVREVRDAAREASALLEVLRAYSTSSVGVAGGWDAHAKRAMAARGAASSELPAPAPSSGGGAAAGLPRPRSSRLAMRVPEPSVSRSSRFSPPVSPDRTSRNRRSSFARSVVSARFLGAHGDADVVVESNRRHRVSAGGDAPDRSSAHSISASGSAAQQLAIPEDEHSFSGAFLAEGSFPQGEDGDGSSPREGEEPLGMDLTLFNANLGPDQNGGGSAMPFPLQGELLPPWSATSLGDSGMAAQQQQQQQQQPEGQNGEHAAHEAGQAHAAQPAMYGSSLEHLQLDDGLRDPHSQPPQPPQQPPLQHMHSADAALAHLQGDGALQGLQPPAPVAGDAAEALQAGAEAVAQEHGTAGDAGPGGGAAVKEHSPGSSRSQGGMVSVPEAEWQELQQKLRDSEQRVAELQSRVTQLEAQARSREDAWMQPSSPKRPAAVALQGTVCGADVNAMYAEALERRTGPTHLLDLMQHTGISWSDLQPQVAHQLLAAFATCAQYPEVLPKAMPWLWRLADEHQTPSHLQPSALPSDTQQAVLDGLQQAAASLECSHAAVSEETERKGSAAAADAAQPLGSA